MAFSGYNYLFILIIIPILVLFFIFSSQNKIQRLKKIGDLNLLNKLIPFESVERQRIKIILTLFAIIFIIIALAGPQFGSRIVDVQRKGIDVIIAMDTSLSMYAQDIKPNRITKAKQELSRLLKDIEGNRIGIIAFAGASFMQCPLTIDHHAAAMFLDFLDVGIVPQQGTEIGEAIRLATRSFSEKETNYKALVLLTDGEDHKSKPIEAAREAKKQGVKIFTIGFGSLSGEVIPMRDASGNIDYKKDEQGSTVISKLDESLLKKIALITDGKYYLSTTGQIEVKKIAQAINLMPKKGLGSKLQNQFEEKFYYFVILALILLIMSFFIHNVRS